MRRIVVPVFVSLDGVMQAPGGPEEDPTGGFDHGGWTFHYFDEALGSVMEAAFSTSFNLLLGRRTYDIFAAHWPHSGDEMGTRFNRVTKYVATHRPDSLSWQNSQWLGEDVVARLKELKREDGPDLMVQGSSELLQTLQSADLVDEYRLLIFPVVLGKGKRLFGRGAIPSAYRLTGSKASGTGVVIASYERDGDIRTGSFAHEEPSPEEIERRRAMG